MYLYIVDATSRVHLVSSCYAAKTRTAANPHIMDTHTHEGPALGEKIASELKCDTMLPPGGCAMQIKKNWKCIFTFFLVFFTLSLM